MYLIDTNIFLEVLLERERVEECRTFLKKLEEGKIRCFVTSFAIHNIELVTINYKRIRELEKFLTALLFYQNLTIHSTSIIEEIETLRVMREFNLDFDDALQYLIAEEFNLKIVSFDKDFDNKPIQRLDPNQVI